MARPTVVVLDYGFGNIRSAQRALERVNAEVTVGDDHAAAERADGLVVPGVGAFAACMAGLRDVDGPAVLAHRLAAGAPVLGVCVGMQVLFDAGVEHAPPGPVLPGSRRAGRGASHMGEHRPRQNLIIVAGVPRHPLHFVHEAPHDLPLRERAVVATTTTPVSSPR
jgi:glutamine amidotransferase